MKDNILFVTYIFKGAAKKVCREKFRGGRLVEIYTNQQQQFLIKWLKKVEKKYKCIDPGYYYDVASPNTDDGYYDYIYWASSTQYLCSEVNWWIGLERCKDSPQVCIAKLSPSSSLTGLS